MCANIKDENKKIKVLRIIGECKTGGTETIALNYYQNLNHQKIGMDFLFYGDSLPRFEEILDKNGDKVINIELYKKHLIKSILQIKNTVKYGEYDIVHSQLNSLNFFPLLGALLGGAKIRIAANHSTANLKYEFKKSIIKYLLRPTVKITATHYAACSEHAGKWLFGKYNIKNKKVKLIHNAIDLENFSFSPDIRNEIRNDMDWNKRFIIGHIGRFITQKNHKYIIDIFKKINQELPDSLLILVGDGELLPQIRQYVACQDLTDNVRFLGVRFDINKLMQGFDVLLFPSIYEGLGNVITEAQAVGLHVVASDTIPREVKMTDYVDFLSLKSPIDIWVRTVKKYSKGYSRLNTHKVLIDNGYEIKTATHDLEKYYQSLLE